jgi:hypothetical protein
MSCAFRQNHDNKGELHHMLQTLALRKKQQHKHQNVTGVAAMPVGKKTIMNRCFIRVGVSIRMSSEFRRCPPRVQAGGNVLDILSCNDRSID